MANVVRFTLPTARTLYVHGAGRFHLGVLDVDANDLAAVSRARYLVKPYGATEVGTVDAVTPIPALPAVPGPPSPDPFPQYVTDQDLANPASGPMVALRTTSEAVIAGGRTVAGSRRRPPRSLTTPTVTSPSINGVIGMLPDGRGKVFGNSGFSASQIGVSQDGATFTWGKNLAGGSGIATGFVMTPGGEALVAVQDRNNAAAGTLWRSTGFNPATMDATSWATVLTASKVGAHMDGRWCLTERSVAPLNSPGAGALFVTEYDGNRAWMSSDGGASWSVIFELQTVRPGANHMHGIAYDRWDDRVWVTIGDNSFAGIYYASRSALIAGTPNPWTLLPGSNAVAWQSTTIVPLAASVVFLSDASDSAVFRTPRVGFREYGSIRKALDIADAGMIGAHAYQAADDLPAYLTFYQSGSGQTPRVYATADGEHFSTVHTDSGTVTGGPGIHSIVGPDTDGYVWATRNLTGSGSLLRLTSP